MPSGSSAAAVASMARSFMWPPAPCAQTKTAAAMAGTSITYLVRNSVALEVRVPGLPEEEGEVVRGLPLALHLGAADAVAGVVVEVEEHGLARCRRGGEARGHLARVPVVDARVVHAVEEHYRRIGDTLLHVVVAAHREERAELVFLGDGAELGDVRNAVRRGFHAHHVERSHRRYHRGEEIGALGHHAPHKDAAGAAAKDAEAR